MRKSLLALLAIVILETSALAVEKIRIGFPDLAAPFVPLAIADKRGFFQEEGLQGEFIRINPAIAFQALVGGEIDYYTVLGPGAAAAIRGVPVKIVAAYVPVAPTALLARPEIKSVPELKGKTIGVNAYGGALEGMAQLPRDLVPKIKGGMSGTEHNGEMYGDYLVEMTTAGKVIWEWRSWEHFDPEADRITAVQERRDEWTHGNGLAELPNGDVVVSFRAISTVIIIDRGTGKIIWKLGAPPLSGQHAPMPLPNGNLLLFDNGAHRLDHPMPFSRVIEVELATKKIVWKYQEKQEYEFYSPRISNAQRLPNGNTLICEGDFGRLFEVTGDGELVWEFVNPYFGEGPNGQNNRVFRAYRYSTEEIARAKDPWKTVTSIFKRVDGGTYEYSYPAAKSAEKK